MGRRSEGVGQRLGRFLIQKKGEMKCDLMTWKHANLSGCQFHDVQKKTTKGKKTKNEKGRTKNEERKTRSTMKS